MIYHVEIGTADGRTRTDTTTRSLRYAEDRRHDLFMRGEAAEVVTGSGRVVIDTFGDRP